MMFLLFGFLEYAFSIKILYKNMYLYYYRNTYFRFSAVNEKNSKNVRLWRMDEDCG